ncbi:enoyl-CoA hydratase-related protein [Tengunoibacter tsumagoiensis]|uniref:Enoyl-CoA hydratase n=1 Tax=Tengunoibacter tsumagoiensis TaxID=2014871 RepID=A0A401ZYW1_9CHLR|nr:enoyl-CoA hydratase-related protein [Tengunoibacter tsumagoiensis]GCE12044.1 enoyl-CoA hydratase [Tengunoibacter tsumagoiensis]
MTGPANLSYLTLHYAFQQKVAIVTMNRPEVRNAFNAQFIAEMTQLLTELSLDEGLHAVVLAANGSAFSSGADIQMMQEAISFSKQENIHEAQRLIDLLQLIYTFPCPVVARIQGDAYGGGLGLIAACDLAIAAEGARFAFSEVKLGIAPAVIAPYVIRKIGESYARVLFVTGERFSATRAQQIGLIHSIVPPDQLDNALQKALTELASSAPKALRACKVLALTAGQMDDAIAYHSTAETIAGLRASPEGQEGLRAFLEKRRPDWQNA